jgi:hypothetical protein
MEASMQAKWDLRYEAVYNAIVLGLNTVYHFWSRLPAQPRPTYVAVALSSIVLAVSVAASNGRVKRLQ